MGGGPGGMELSLGGVAFTGFLLDPSMLVGPDLRCTRWVYAPELLFDQIRDRSALGKTMVASIGPITTQRLRHHHFPVDFEPSHSKIGILVKEASAHVGGILNQKQNT